jgi:hypothetical protein
VSARVGRDNPMINERWGAHRRGGARAGGAAPLAGRPASVSALVDRLERAGHVRRLRDPQDRRRVVLEMSDEAMAAGAEHFGGLQRDLVGAMGGYSDEELAVVRRFLGEMTEVIERHAGAGGDLQA